MKTNTNINNYSEISYEDCFTLINNINQTLDPDNLFTIKVLDKNCIQAQALDKRIIEIDTALIRKVNEIKKDEHELQNLISFIIAHEMGHIELGHTNSDPKWYNKVCDFIVAFFEFLLIVATGLLYLKYIQKKACQDELDADIYALKLLKSKGIDPQNGIYMHEAILQAKPAKPSLRKRIHHFLTYTHPPLKERIAYCQNYIDTHLKA